jgi:hypothetical protein
VPIRDQQNDYITGIYKKQEFFSFTMIFMKVLCRKLYPGCIEGAFAFPDIVLGKEEISVVPRGECYALTIAPVIVFCMYGKKRS